MGKPWAIVLLALFSSAAFGQDSAPAIPVEPEVAPSEAAAALAEETCRELNALHYRFADTGAARLVISYAVKRDGEPKGRLDLSWERETNALSCTYPGQRGAEWRKGVADIVRMGIDTALVSRYEPEGAYAERRGGSTVVDLTGPEAGGETKRVLMKVSPDYRRIDRRRWFASGSVREQTATVAEVQGRICVTGYTSRLHHPDGTLRRWTFEFTYAKLEGNHVPQHVGLEVAKGDQTVKLELTLAKIAVGAGTTDGTDTPAAEPVIPKTGESALLGAETAERLNALHFSLLGTDLQGFSATFTVNRAGFAMGRLKTTWTRGAELVTAKAVGDFDEDTRSIVQDLGSYGLQTALLTDWRTAGLHGVRQGDNILLENLAPGALPDSTMRRAIFEFSKDLLRLRTRIWYRDGKVSEDRITLERSGDLAYVASHLENIVPRSEDDVRLHWTFKYCHREGRVFLKRLRVESELGDVRETWEYVLENVEFGSPEEETVPDPAEEARAAEVLTRAKGVHYALDRMGVKGFEAFFGLHWKGYSAGGIRFRWNLAESQFLVDHEGAVPFALSEEFEETNQVSFEEWVRVWASSWLWDAVALFPRPDSGLSVRAKSNADETVVLYKAKRPEHALKLRALVFTPEGVLASREERYTEGQCVLSVFRQEAVEGKYLRRTTNEAIKETGGFTWNRIVNYTYRRTQGLLFPSLIEIRTEPAAAHMDVTETIMTLKELKVRK